MKRYIFTLIISVIAASAYSQAGFKLNGVTLKVNSDTYIDCDMDLRLEENAVVENDGTIKASQDVYIFESISLEETATAGIQGTLEFDGTSQQQITGETGAILATEILSMDNSSTEGVSQQIDIKTTTKLSLDDGYLVIASGKTLTMEDGAVASNSIGHIGSTSSYVDGQVLKIGSSDFRFPLGDEGYYKPLGIKNLSGSDTFYAQYSRSNPNDNGYDVDSKLDVAAVSSVEYWDLGRSGSESANVELYYDEHSGTIEDINHLLVSHWDGSQWEDYGVLTVDGDINSGWVTSETVSNFSPFTIGSSSASSALPVEFSGLDVKCGENGQEIIWTTASEYNNDFFSIEKSINGDEFTTIKTIESKGNSSSMEKYSTIDNENCNNCYYRIKQNDYDGLYSYSEPIHANCSNITGLNIYYSNQSIFITISTSANENIGISITDINGKELHSLHTEIQKGLNKRTVVIPLTQGVYNCKISSINTYTNLHFVAK